MQNFAELLPLRKDAAWRNRLKSLSQTTRQDWAARPSTKILLSELERFGEGQDFTSCDELRNLFTDYDKAKGLIREWSACLTAMLGHEPLAQPDFGHQKSGGIASMRLATSGRAELSVVSFEPAEGEAAAIETMRFFDCERYEIILAGAADALFAQVEPSAVGADLVHSRRKRVVEGQFYQSPKRPVLGSRVFTEIRDRVVILRLVRQPVNPKPTRAIRLSDGTTVGQSCGDKRASCQEVMLTVLGRMGRKDAVPAMAQLARSGSDHLRWEAIRQCLALDVAQGFSLLCETAKSPDDPLASHAGTLRAQLLEAHPQLARLERERCPD